MTWEELKKVVYLEDGSLRDIIVPNSTIDDWALWVTYVNANYTVEFYNGKIKTYSDKIDFDVIKEYWNGLHDLCCNASITINSFVIKVYFFEDNEIENDFCPKEILSMHQHEALLQYLVNVSNLLKKKVLLTAENTPEVILLSINPVNH